MASGWPWRSTSTVSWTSRSVRADGSGFRRLTEDEAVDVQPAWSPDGRTVIFASARSWDFDVMRVDVETREIEMLIGGGGNQFQPAPSPDGSRVAYIDRVPGRLGSGGIWTVPIGGGEPTLIHYEETSYRAVPTWTPEGTELVFASDDRGFVRSRVGASAGRKPSPADLRTGRTSSLRPSAQMGAGSHSSATKAARQPSTWRPVSGAATATGERLNPNAWSLSTRPRRSEGRVTGPDGSVVPARIQILAADGRATPPTERFIG